MFNVSIAVGLGMVAAGTFIAWGPGVALTTTGALVVVLSLYSAERLRGRR